MNKIDYLDIHDVLQICERIIPNLAIRDQGLLQSAIERPRTTVFGEDAYKTFPEKAAALMHSLARNHPLVDGNKRLAWSATRTFCLLNGYDINLNVDDAESLVLGVAAGKFDVPQIIQLLNLKRV
jgi:death on curing protein